MYEDDDHIETAEEGKLFGHRGEYKYRVLGRDRDFVVHHTNSMNNAKWYLQKCRDLWLKNG